MALKPYLQLVRLPNVVTAAADSLAGWLLATGGLDEPGRWLPLVGASMAIYAGGIALNDRFDYEVDLRERPGRPLPSGRVSKRFATVLGVGLLAAGLGLTSISGSDTSVLVGLALVGCVLLYDVGLKRTALGPQLMGACRGLNLLLGLSQLPDLGGPPAWLAAGSMAVFVAGITWISRSETESGRTAGLYAGILLQNLGILGLLGAALQAGKFPPAATSAPPIVPVEGLLVIVLVAWAVNLAGSHAVRRPEPAHLQKAVKTAVLSLVWLDVGLVAAVRGVPMALAVAALWPPAYLLGRRLYST